MVGAGLLSITNAQTIAADFVAIDAYVQQQVDVSHIAGAILH
jgi:hypothetical protein